MSHEIYYVAEAEAFDSAEGNMCGAVMRGVDAPPGSKTSSRTKGMRWNLGYLTSGRVAFAGSVRIGKVLSRSR